MSIDYICLRNFETSKELRVSQEQFNERFIELVCEKGYRVTNENSHMTDAEKFHRMASFTIEVNGEGKDPDRVIQFIERGRMKGES
jgi:hypothetical protein